MSDFRFGAARFMPEIEAEPAFVPMTEREKRRPSWLALNQQWHNEDEIAAHYANRETWRPSKTAQAFDRANFTPMPKAEQSKPADSPQDRKPGSRWQPKIGDRVKVTRDVFTAPRFRGEEFVVAFEWNGCASGIRYVSDSDGLAGVSADELELVPVAKPAEPYRFKVGDRVRALVGRYEAGWAHVKPGDEGTVIVTDDDPTDGGDVRFDSNGYMYGFVPQWVELIPTPEKPKTGEWIEWAGEGMPVLPHLTILMVKLRNGEELHYIFDAGSDSRAWSHLWGPADIVAYREAA